MAKVEAEDWRRFEDGLPEEKGWILVAEGPVASLMRWRGHFWDDGDITFDTEDLADSYTHYLPIKLPGVE